jgi:hypothetical protein
MPKRTIEQMIAEIKMLAEHIEHSIEFAFESGINLQWIGIAKRRAQELAVECQRLEDLESDGIEEAVQHLRKGLEDE